LIRCSYSVGHFRAALVTEVDVDQDDVRLQLRGTFDRLRAVDSDADHTDFLPVEERAEASRNLGWPSTTRLRSPVVPIVIEPEIPVFAGQLDQHERRAAGTFRLVRHWLAAA
jgi:hypothetical protein